MKSKEQKRAEAIERARDRYVSSPYPRLRYTEEEYLDLFRSKEEAQKQEFAREEAEYQARRIQLRQEMGL